MLDSSTRAHIERELERLNRLRDDYEDLLRTQPDDGPDLVGRTALSAVVPSFYQGVEDVFQTIAKGIDCEMPTSADWHRQLLRQMATDSDSRPRR